MKIAFLSVLALLAAGPARAAATAIETDRADNSFTFTYDADRGEIDEAASSTILTRGDKVTFYTYADERLGAPEGERLRGRITLRLSKKQSVVYDGIFTYTVLDDLGQVVHRAAKERRIRLRPRQGQRSARLRFFYDLPTGSYSLNATFSRGQ